MHLMTRNATLKEPVCVLFTYKSAKIWSCLWSWWHLMAWLKLNPYNIMCLYSLCSCWTCLLTCNIYLLFSHCIVIPSLIEKLNGYTSKYVFTQNTGLFFLNPLISLQSLMHFIWLVYVLQFTGLWSFSLWVLLIDHYLLGLAIGYT